MLGGNNEYNKTGSVHYEFYYIGHLNRICSWPISESYRTYVIFTLEEFLEKFPYKVGDEVLINDDINDVYTIKSMIWDTDLERVAYKIEAIDGIEDDHCWFADEMERYLGQKEETIENKGTLVEIDLTREESKAEEIEVILGDYEFVLKDGKTYFVKKKPKYPKTYEECARLLNTYCTMPSRPGYKEALIAKFQELLICRKNAIIYGIKKLKL